MAHEILTRTDNRDIPGEAHLLIYGQKENSWRGAAVLGNGSLRVKKIMLRSLYQTNESINILVICSVSLQTFHVSVMSLGDGFFLL